MREREREVGFIDKKHIHGAKELLLLQVKSFKSQNNNIPKISQFLLYLWRSNFNREYQTLNFCFSSSPQKSDQWNLSISLSLIQLQQATLQHYRNNAFPPFPNPPKKSYQ